MDMRRRVGKGGFGLDTLQSLFGSETRGRRSASSFVRRATASIAKRTRRALDAALTPCRLGFSAHGEDILVLSWFAHYGIDPATVTYLDIGAAHPWKLSNTFNLYRHGARGVLVEPDPDQAAVLRELRPRDTVLNVGAAFDERRSALLIRMSARGFNTFSQEQAEFVVSSSQNWGAGQRQEIRDRIEVTLVPINDIIERHLHDRAPDFLSIDEESKDLDVLKNLDLNRFKPRIICVKRPGPAH